MSIITKKANAVIPEGTVLTETQLALRAFLLGSFWRNGLEITEKSYIFCDDWLKNEDLDIASKADADNIIKQAYETFK